MTAATLILQKYQETIQNEYFLLLLHYRLVQNFEDEISEALCRYKYFTSKVDSPAWHLVLMGYAVNKPTSLLVLSLVMGKTLIGRPLPLSR